MPYNFKTPELVNSPKSKNVEVVKVIFKGGENPNYSLAIIKWDGDYKIGIRWNISYDEWSDPRKEAGQVECIGNPQSRGIPTWFVIPDTEEFPQKIADAIRQLAYIKKEWK